jgi:tRNA(Arg) A34 adenosine deaminase TadA
MDQATFVKTNTTPGDLAALKKAFQEKKPKAAFFVPFGGTTVYYSLAGDHPYDPIWALYGTGLGPNTRLVEAYTNYPESDMSVSEKGIRNLMTLRLNWNKDESIFGAEFGSKPAFKMTMAVAAPLRGVYPVPTEKKQRVSDIQSESASIKETDTGKMTVAGNRNVHRLYMATAFTILRKQHKGTDKDGVVALVVDKQGNIISWGRKNPAIPCWHGETSSIMGLGGVLPSDCAVYSTLKSCHMCASLIHQLSNGGARVFWGQDDPGSAAAGTDLDTSRRGSLLDGNKSHVQGAKAILLGAKSDRKVMATSLAEKFENQPTVERSKGKGKPKVEKEYPSTIDFATSGKVDDLLIGAERALANKYKKYQGSEVAARGNVNTNAVINYLIDFLTKTLNLSVDAG